MQQKNLATQLVALNSDESVKSLNKGTNRPINKLEDRIYILSNLISIDLITSFNDSTQLNLLKG